MPHAAILVVHLVVIGESDTLPRMDIFFQIAPLVALIAVATFFVFKGMKTKPDDTSNKARGGGSESHTQFPPPH